MRVSAPEYSIEREVSILNWLAEEVAFYDRIETNPLSPPEIALWHALMAVNNKSGWQNNFAVSASVLEAKTGLNKKAVERARNSLASKGLIKWSKRNGRQSAVYEIISLVSLVGQKYSANCRTTCRSNVPQPVAQPVPQSVAIIQTKLNETLPTTAGACAEAEDEAKTAELVAEYEQNIGTISRAVFDRIEYWRTQLPPDVIAACIREAAGNNVRNWNYIESILRRCIQTNITSAAAFSAEKENARHRRATGKQQNNKQAEFLALAQEEENDTERNSAAAGSMLGLLAGSG